MSPKVELPEIKTLAELRSAYIGGRVTAPVMLDNDDVSVYQDDREVYGSDPDQLLEDALDLLGIPWEHV